ncbi:uncharacterized protein [Equus asinus]|uniref:uncharacterized protein n=1 Tax=Equus asinus TaxID=9793 RepID=UPI0038F6DAC3
MAAPAPRPMREGRQPALACRRQECHRSAAAAMLQSVLPHAVEGGTAASRSPPRGGPAPKEAGLNPGGEGPNPPAGLARHPTVSAGKSRLLRFSSVFFRRLHRFGMLKEEPLSNVSPLVVRRVFQGWTLRRSLLPSLRSPLLSGRWGLCGSSGLPSSPWRQQARVDRVFSHELSSRVLCRRRWLADSSLLNFELSFRLGTDCCTHLPAHL